MRFIKKLLVTGGVAAALIAGAVAAPATASASPFVGDWGPYFSADHKAEAEGKYILDHEKKKVWYWEKFKKPIKKCWWEHGDKKCKVVGWKWDKKWSWKWEEYTKITVKGELTNHKWWGDKKYKCAWAVFKIEDLDGHTSYEKFKNCDKGSDWIGFTEKNVNTIDVQVSRGNFFGPKGFYGPWSPVYAAV
ncbi:hypothetical protein [Herbidospora sp. RD11066]